MDANVVFLIVITAINVIGWVYTKVFGIGRLREQVENHDRILNNGIVKELGEVKTQCANLEGTIKTYIKLREGR